jgi:threonine dehydrogenase-like Zn-dependent dehydrogenase
MKALMVQPKSASSLRIEEIGEPPLTQGDVLVEAVALGVCGTDREIMEGKYGSPPSGHKRLVIGHESLGRVVDSPAGSPVKAGDLVVPFVRMPDPVPCDCCAAGQWDRCRNGQFTEHGIKDLDGFGRERYRVPSDHLIKLPNDLGVAGVLMEPTSVVARAWMQLDAMITNACWKPNRVLVTGGGPVGLLAAMLGVQRGMQVTVFDRATEGLKPSLVRELGARYQTGTYESLGDDFDILVECTGAPALVLGAAMRLKPDGICCLLGVSSQSTSDSVDGGALNDRLVLGNRVVFGSVNANRSHYEAALDGLKKADRKWLDRLLTRRVPLDDALSAFEKDPDGVKTIVVFPPAATLTA